MEKTSLTLAALLAACTVLDAQGGGGAMADPEGEMLIERIQNESGGGLSALIDEAQENRLAVNEDLRAEMAGEIAASASRSADQGARKSAVRYLMDEAHSLEVSAPNDFALGTLLKFRAADFSETERERIASTIQDISPSALYSRLAGVAQATEAEPVLRQLANSADEAALDPVRAENDVAWSSLVALARMGDTEMIGRAIARVEATDDPADRAAFMFRELAFTARSESLNWLVNQLDDMERLPPLKGSGPGTPVGWYAARAINSVTQGGPDIVPLGEEEGARAVKAWASGLSGWPIIR